MTVRWISFHVYSLPWFIQVAFRINPMAVTHFERITKAFMCLFFFLQDDLELVVCPGFCWRSWTKIQSP